MPSTDSPKPAMMAGRLGGHLVLSLSIAAAIAGLVNLPRLFAPETAAPAAIARLDTAPLSFTADGKFADRLDTGSGEDRDARPFTPAMLAMPMSVGWSEPQAAESASASPVVTPSSATGKLRSAAAGRPALPPRRDPALAAGAQRIAVDAPMPITPATVAAAPAAPRDAESKGSDWVRLVTAPVAKAAEIVSGAAGRAEAAGSWTVSQASGLLPRW